MVVGDDAERELAEWFARKGGDHNADPHAPGRAKPLTVSAKRREALKSGQAGPGNKSSQQSELPLDAPDAAPPAPADNVLPSHEEPVAAPADTPVAVEPSAPARRRPKRDEAVQRPPPDDAGGAKQNPGQPEIATEASPLVLGAEAAQMLERLAADVRDGRRAAGEALCVLDGGKFLVRYPEGAALYVKEPMELMRLLRDEGAIEVDPWTKRVTHVIGGINGLALTAPACAVVLAALSAPRQTAAAAVATPAPDAAQEPAQQPAPPPAEKTARKSR
jgi:hypothetical protein